MKSGLFSRFRISNKMVNTPSPLAIILDRQEAVDNIIRATFDGNGDSQLTPKTRSNEVAQPPFSSLFPQLFKKSPYIRENLLSFLEPMSTSFSYRVRKDSRAEQATRGIMDDLQLTDVDDNVFYFVAYLIEVYGILRNDLSTSPPILCQNIFAFLTRNKLKDIKVAFIFKTPSGREKNCGFAIHGANVDTTWKVLEYVNNDLNLFAKLCPSDVSENLRLTPVELAQRKSCCIFDDWITQGVLLMNSWLTYNHTIWKHFNNHVVKALSNECDNVVFVLVGEEAWHKEKFIQKEINHLVLRVYHPGHPTHNNIHLRWNNIMPFLNANFFLYQASNGNSERIIDWNSMSIPETERKKRQRQTGRLFESLVTNPEWIYSINGNIIRVTKFPPNTRYIIKAMGRRL